MADRALDRNAMSATQVIHEGGEPRDERTIGRTGGAFTPLLANPV